MADACCTRHQGKQQAFSAEEERMLKIARTANDLSRFLMEIGGTDFARFLNLHLLRSRMQPSTAATTRLRCSRP